MTFYSDLRETEPEPDDADTEKIVTLTRLPDACITVTLVSPDLTVHNVMKGSYIHRIMVANGYKEQVKS